MAVIEQITGAASTGWYTFAQLTPIFVIIIFLVLAIWYFISNFFLWNITVRLHYPNGNVGDYKGRIIFNKMTKQPFMKIKKYAMHDGQMPLQSQFYWEKSGMNHRVVEGAVDNHGIIHWLQKKITVPKSVEVIDPKTQKISYKRVSTDGIDALEAVTPNEKQAHLSAIERAYRKNMITPEKILKQIATIAMVVLLIALIGTGFNSWMSKKTSDNLAQNTQASAAALMANARAIDSISHVLETKYDYNMSAGAPISGQNVNVITPANNVVTGG